jgi:hypothetical protein
LLLSLFFIFLIWDGKLDPGWLCCLGSYLILKSLHVQVMDGSASLVEARGITATTTTSVTAKFIESVAHNNLIKTS